MAMRRRSPKRRSVGVRILSAVSLTATIVGCGDKAPTGEKIGDMTIVFDADCKWLESNARKEMESALTRFDKIDVVYGHNDPQAHGAWLAARAEGQGREQSIEFIGIDANPDEGKKYVREGILSATLEYPTGAAEAIDVALLILSGLEVPKNISLATTLYTKDNLDSGGIPVEAPGAAMVAELRAKHAGILKPDPANAAKWTIGMSQCNLGEPWRVRMNQEVEAAAAKYPQLKVVYKDAQNDSQTQRNQVEEFLTQKIDLLIVSPKETVPLTPPVKKVFEAKVPVIVLDRSIQGDTYTCFIGGNNTLIGRTAGRYIGHVMQGKGNIVELKGLMTTDPAHERHDGFIQGLKDYIADPAGIDKLFTGGAAATQPAGATTKPE
ncbi:MAG: substrate-binding domain-containing protein [Planctomycetes bacterium]|nr:substrate-binding domain-containing protein [Planctomycetota bacterium]